VLKLSFSLFLLQQEEFTQDDDLYNDVITASSSADSVEVRFLIILFLNPLSQRSMSQNKNYLILLIDKLLSV
jgi:hypothetical protein